jgi:signal transduction histidine kinase
MGRDTGLLHQNKPKLFYKLILLTGSMGVIFILLFWLVIVVSEDQLELISLHHWLESEAAMFERDYTKFGNRESIPNHYEFDIYFSDSKIPNWLESYTTVGFFEHHLGAEDKHFLVKKDPSGTGLFYVVFKDDADDYLDEYENKLHLVALSLGLLITLLMFSYGLYLVWLISAPLQRVLAKIKQMPPNQPDFNVDARYNELAIIEQALLDSKRRTANYFQREQDFSRFAAHEIRTPLMVLQGSAELLQQLNLALPAADKASQRILQASSDIILLTDTFLLLGKEDIDKHHYQRLDLADTLTQCMKEIQTLHQNSHIDCQLHILNSLELYAPPSFIIVLINNVLKNAYSYGETYIDIKLLGSELRFRNDFKQKNRFSGYGYGLVIIERICERMGWRVTNTVTANEFNMIIHF